MRKPNLVFCVVEIHAVRKINHITMARDLLARDFFDSVPSCNIQLGIPPQHCTEEQQGEASSSGGGRNTNRINYLPLSSPASVCPYLPYPSLIIPPNPQYEERVILVIATTENHGWKYQVSLGRVSSLFNQFNRRALGPGRRSPHEY